MSALLESPKRTPKVRRLSYVSSNCLRGKSESIRRHKSGQVSPPFGASRNSSFFRGPSTTSTYDQKTMRVLHRGLLVCRDTLTVYY